MKVTSEHSKKVYSYYFNNDDKFVIKNGYLSGSYSLNTDTTDYDLVPVSKNSNNRKLILVRND